MHFRSTVLCVKCYKNKGELSTDRRVSTLLFTFGSQIVALIGSPLFKLASAPLALTRKCILPLRLSFIGFSKRLKHVSVFLLSS